MCNKSVVILKKLETALGKINSSRSSSSLPLCSLQPRSFFGPRPSLRLPLWPKRCACTAGQATTIDQLGKHINFLQVKKKIKQTSCSVGSTAVFKFSNLISNTVNRNLFIFHPFQPWCVISLVFWLKCFLKFGFFINLNTLHHFERPRSQISNYNGFYYLNSDIYIVSATAFEHNLLKMN